MKSLARCLRVRYLRGLGRVTVHGFQGFACTRTIIQNIFTFKCSHWTHLVPTGIRAENDRCFTKSPPPVLNKMTIKMIIYYAIYDASWRTSRYNFCFNAKLWMGYSLKHATKLWYELRKNIFLFCRFKGTFFLNKFGVNTIKYLIQFAESYCFNFFNHYYLFLLQRNDEYAR